jgi:hypothetical protein
MAHIKSDCGFAGDRGDNAWLAGHCTNGGDAIVVFANIGNGKSKSRSSAETVTSHGHGHCASVGCLTSEDQSLALNSLRASDSANTEIH